MHLFLIKKTMSMSTKRFVEILSRKVSVLSLRLFFSQLLKSKDECIGRHVMLTHFVTRRSKKYTLFAKKKRMGKMKATRAFQAVITIH